ncbi:MAG: NAD(+) diphosphatase, partial [Muribaculaceae bacterium]|nr:NAD(+) diphosphatase [Muribaculaceae bacterium]
MRELLLIGAGRIILMKHEGAYRLPREGEIPIPEGEGTFTFPGYVAACVPDDFNPEGDCEAIGLRESWALLPPDRYAAASKGAELLYWEASERFCCRDGAPLRRNSEISKICPVCGKEYFPRLNPAIVVLVLRGEEALLVHASTLKNPDVLTLVAGYVETGENLEECVRREIKEETDIEVDDVKYFGSQAWPFPNQLMMGFTARYKSGELRFADGEITAGGFFTPDNMPVLPTMPSLSRVIIEAWREGKFSKC